MFVWHISFLISLFLTAPGIPVSAIIGAVVGVVVLFCVLSILIPVLICCCLGCGIFATLGCACASTKKDQADLKVEHKTESESVGVDM